MPNIFDANGLQVRTRQELVDFWTAKYQEIYGADINLASDTPDGQMMNIQIQETLDLQDLLVEINSSFDPDNAVGVILDQRVAINGIQRLGGTYTITPVTLVTAQSVNLYGLDQTVEPVYTVADNIGTRWQLETTQLGLPAGTTSLLFRAELPGEQLTVPNTVTVPVTIVLGVSSINNPTALTVLGENEETDGQLKIRRQRSVALASQGYLAGLYAALQNIDGVTSAFVYENLTGVTDSDGVPGHSIWVIVAGTGADADIAQAIYRKRNAGCGMFGETSYTITQVDGSPFIVEWDTALTRRVFIAFTATPIDGVTPVDITGIRAGLPTLLTPDVNEEINVNEVATLARQIDPNALITNAGISDGETQAFAFSAVAASGAFKIAYNGEETTSIPWNTPTASIENAIQALTGLSAATVTGSIASQSLVFDLSLADNGPQGLLYVIDSTLQDSGSADISVTYSESYQNILAPNSKRYEFVLTPDDVIITQMILNPTDSAVATTEDVQFTALGGYGDYVYSISVNGSGATIDPDTGLYTAGGSSGTDTVVATDAFGNTASATVVVA